MMNVHTPERHPDETLEGYRDRQKRSRAIARQHRISAPNPSTAPSKRSKKSIALAGRVFDSGQHPKFDQPRRHREKEPIKPTWPESEDQKAQSRPLIVLGKNRERDPLKRDKPKSAVSKRMDRPHRSAMMEAGHAKLMKFLGIA